MIYDGKKQLTEPFTGNIFTDISYKVFGAENRNVYYGTYRCIKRVRVDWEVLASFGREVSARFAWNPPSNEVVSLWHPSWAES